ncbi:Retrovirus-related Pol polyprotein from transposon TNT 1-94 [Vitis vinifera]|uniref:Retrovirus-related Pol polyprotein from transposon TNT 1-94 n=1 Tax=Vitis vinifera TaxID=29760 RepID=A0A438C9Z2_VITVI|nr:Retrovirus-related Pol polyprotein from transposon TNT 1-94 [Vitis vinifera]
MKMILLMLNFVSYHSTEKSYRIILQVILVRCIWLMVQPWMLWVWEMSRISLPNGSVWLLEKVRHIPDLRRNLISVGQLDDEGHAILFVGGTWKVTKGARVLARGKKTDWTPKAEKLELVHTDLWGSPVASLGETGLKVKCLRSDNGGEYIDGGFSEYCVAQGIRMEKTILGHHNRMHCSLPDKPNHQFPWSSDFLRRFGGKEVDLSTPIAEVRRSSRNIRPPQHYSPVLNYLLLTDGGESECYDEALQDENSSKWDRKEGFAQQWVYRIKNEHNGSKRYKARLVVKGFQQKEGIDFTEIFSPIVKMSTIRLVLGMVAAENLHLEQLDVKTAFLHDDLEEDIYMIQPKWFIVQGQENLVYKLRNSLCEADHYCYVKSFDNSYIILLLYVDDMLIAGFDIEKINNLKKQLSKQFAMKDLGAAKQILGMRIIRDKANGTLKFSQSEYVKKVLSRPDIAYVVGVVSRFMSRPGKQHWEAVKWILRYLKDSLDTCLCFTGASLKLQDYVDADFAGDIDSRKSTTGFVFTLGGTVISWASNLQKIVTLSTTEAEYVATIEARKKMI